MRVCPHVREFLYSLEVPSTVDHINVMRVELEAPACKVLKA